MHELYLWPFADSVKAGVASVMCSYNKINGQSVPLAVVSFFVFLLFFLGEKGVGALQCPDIHYIKIRHSLLTENRDVGM